MTILKKLLLGLIPLVVLLAVGEIVARMIPGDFESKRFFYIAGGHEEYYGTEKRFSAYEAHPPYYWVGRPNTSFFNSRGLRGEEWSLTKAPGQTRVAILGCSCTLGGQEPYADRIERVLNESLGTNRYEVMNGGIGSSSTHQILQILEQRMLDLKPDVITVFSGWNDRWVHDGRRDARHRLPSKTSSGLRDWLTKNSRLFKALVYVADKRDTSIEQRVPPEDYERNLRKLCQIAKQNGARIILCTTPDGSPDYMINSRFDLSTKGRNWDVDLYELYKDKGATPVEVWNYIQRVYNDIVKKVAAEEGVELLDLDALVRERRAAYQEPPFYLFKDGIHLSELGLQELGVLFARQIATEAERPNVDAYVGSVPYLVTNAAKFAEQKQYFVSDFFLSKADAQQGAPVAGIDPLRAEIAANLEFYKLFDMGRIELSNRGNPDRVDELWRQCLAMRPDDQNLRLELAGLSMQRNRFEEAFQTALGGQFNYTPENAHRALWIGAEAANALGRREIVIQILRQLDQQFRDPRARQALMGGSRS